MRPASTDAIHAARSPNQARAPTKTIPTAAVPSAIWTRRTKARESTIEKYGGEKIDVERRDEVQARCERDIAADDFRGEAGVDRRVEPAVGLEQRVIPDLPENEELHGKHCREKNRQRMTFHTGYREVEVDSVLRTAWAIPGSAISFSMASGSTGTNADRFSQPVSVITSMSSSRM